jgi:hypothetical protein
LEDKKRARSSLSETAASSVGSGPPTQLETGGRVEPKIQALSLRTESGVGTSSTSSLATTTAAGSEDRERKHRAIRRLKKWKRGKTFWKTFLRERQQAWFEFQCPKGLEGTTKQVLRERSRFDAKMPGPEWQSLTASGKTELEALYSLNVQLGLLVWRRVIGFKVDVDAKRSPLPVVLTRDGKGWRATSVRGLQRDFEPGEEPPGTLLTFVFAKGSTRERALVALADKLGVKVKFGTFDSLAVLSSKSSRVDPTRVSPATLERSEPAEAAPRQVGPGLAWSDDEARLLEDGG